MTFQATGDPMCPCGCGAFIFNCVGKREPAPFVVPPFTSVLEKCEHCWRPRFSRQRLAYELPPDGVATCPEKHGVSCNYTARRRDATLLKAYKRLADAQHKAILAFDAGAKPGHRTRDTISQAAALIQQILSGAPLQLKSRSADDSGDAR